MIKLMNTKQYNTLNNFYDKANALRLDNLYKEAVQNYLNAILIDRNNAESYFGLGICYKNLNQYSKAIKYLDMASQLKEDFYDENIQSKTKLNIKSNKNFES